MRLSAWVLLPLLLLACRHEKPEPTTDDGLPSGDGLLLDHALPLDADDEDREKTEGDGNISDGDILFTDEEEPVDDTPPADNPRLLADMIPGPQECYSYKTIVSGERIFISCAKLDGEEKGLTIFGIPGEEGEGGTPRVIEQWPEVTGGGFEKTRHGIFLHLGNELLFLANDRTEFHTLAYFDKETPRYALLPVGDTLYLWGYTDKQGIEPWRSDGTPEGTRILRDLTTGPGSTAYYKFWRGAETGRGRHEIYFLATSRTGRALYRSDGTAQGTVPLSGILPDDSRDTTIRAHFHFNGHDHYFVNKPINWPYGQPDISALWFFLLAQHIELFRSDMTTGVTEQILEWGQQGGDFFYNAEHLCDTPERAFFILSRYSAHPAYHQPPSWPTFEAVLENTSLYAVNSNGELSLVESGPFKLGPGFCVEASRRLYYVKDRITINYLDDEALSPYFFGSGEGPFFVSGTHLMTPYDQPLYGIGRELYTYSTKKPWGSAQVADICLGPCSSSPSGFTPYRNGLIFSAYKALYGRELWFYDPDHPITAPWLFTP